MALFTVAVGLLAMGGVLLGLGIWRLRAADAKQKAGEALRASEGPGPIKKVQQCVKNGECKEVEQEDRSMLPSSAMIADSMGMKMGGLWVTASGAACLVVGLLIAVIFAVQFKNRKTNTQ